MDTRQDQSSHNVLFKDIIEDINEIYGSLQEPTYSILTKRMEKNQYSSLVEEISKHSSILDDLTDPNYCVSLWLALVNKRGLVFFLLLSFVGKYAILLAAEENRMDTENPEYKRFRVLENHDSILAEDQWIFHVLKKQHIQVVPCATATKTIQMNLYDNNHPSIFRVLFADLVELVSPSD